ncbi:MAG: hypothetical protein WDO14_06325 [Bacteroidota bacterium]
MKHFTMLILFVVGYAGILSAQTITLDLASLEPNERKVIDFYPDSFDSIALINAFAEKYEIKVRSVPKMLDPIDASGFGLNAAGGDCGALEKLFTEIGAYVKTPNKTEKEFADKIESLKELRDKAGSCSGEILAKVKALLKTTRQGSPWIKTQKKRGEDIEIHVKRGSIEWVFVVEGDPIGRWLFTYGYGFTPARNNNEYFTQRVPGDTTYAITKKKAAKNLDFTPAVFVTFLPTKRTNKPVSLTLSGGLGFDLQKPVVFAGAGLLIYQNFLVSGGVGLKSMPQLKGNYSEGQIVNENLDSDALHENKININYFFSVSFRFKENPFKKKDSKELSE